MLNKKMETAINEQINAELYSSYLYLSMAAWFTSKNLRGFATWMKVQALEELYHAMKQSGFVEDRGGRPLMAAIAKPQLEWDSPLAAFEHALEHERMVTGRIDALMDLAAKEKDHASTTFFQWFVNEQVEEEANADAVVQKLKLGGDQGAALFMIDQELGARIFTIMPDVKVPIVPAAAGSAP